jgi:hypothetical protein
MHNRKPDPTDTLESFSIKSLRGEAFLDSKNSTMPINWLFGNMILLVTCH